mmetsp:Transcript_204/g.252  ORF Transcript_204/g.252 Transcript_204/m.252 type:complete len:100 (-) Transcript_204:307-606(-)
MSNPMNRTSLQLYRDCMRLVRHIAPGHTGKSMALRTMVRSQFEKSRNEKDPAAIENLKANAVRGLSNYMLYESGAKDEKLSKAMTRFHDQAVKNVQTEK